MSVYRYQPGQVTPTAGLWSGNTLKILGRLCNQVYVKADTSTTTFDLSVTDPDSVAVRKFTNITGTLERLEGCQDRACHGWRCKHYRSYWIYENISRLNDAVCSLGCSEVN